MECFLTATGAYLPDDPVANERISDFLGSLDGEAEVARSVLAMNGIVQRHYAQDEEQRATHDVYDLATRAAQACLTQRTPLASISFLAAGTTYAPLAAPGLASIVHDRLQAVGRVTHPLEISSHAGICTASAAVRSVQSGEHHAALSIGAEHASEVLAVARPGPRRRRWTTAQTVANKSRTTGTSAADLSSERLYEAPRECLRHSAAHQREARHRADRASARQTSQQLATTAHR